MLLFQCLTLLVFAILEEKKTYFCFGLLADINKEITLVIILCWLEALIMTAARITLRSELVEICALSKNMTGHPPATPLPAANLRLTL